MRWRIPFTVCLLALACLCDAHTRAGLSGTAATSNIAEQDIRILRSPLDNAGSGTFTTANTAYFIFVGKTTQAITPKYVEFYVSTAGAGGQTAEVGLFSTPAAPNKAGQTLTKLVSTGTVSDLTTTGMDRNSTAFTTEVAAGTYLWAGVRIDMATTEPIIRFLSFDMSEGFVLETAAAAALTGAGPWTGTIIALSTSGICPDLRVTLD